MKTRQLLGSASMALLLLATPASAQFGSIVYDPSAVAQLTTQVSYQLRNGGRIVDNTAAKLRPGRRDAKKQRERGRDEELSFH